MNMYQPGEKELQQIQRAFTYHKPLHRQPIRYEEIRMIAGDMAARLVRLCPPSRELSLALTKLEEAVMHANAAIARNEPNHTMLERPDADPTVSTEEIAKRGGSLPFSPVVQEACDKIADQLETPISKDCDDNK